MTKNRFFSCVVLFLIFTFTISANSNEVKVNNNANSPVNVDTYNYRKYTIPASGIEDGNYAIAIKNTSDNKNYFIQDNNYASNQPTLIDLDDKISDDVLTLDSTLENCIWEIKNNEEPDYFSIKNKTQTLHYLYGNPDSYVYSSENGNPSSSAYGRWDIIISSNLPYLFNLGTGSSEYMGIDSNGYLSMGLYDCPITFYKEDKYSVTFDGNGHGGETIPESQTIIYGNKVTKPDDPSDSNYKFMGWYKENTCVNVWDFSNDTITENTTLFAKWIAIPTITTIGGYVKNGEDKQKIVGFGVTFSDYTSLTEGSECGIYIYSSESSETPIKSFYTSDYEAIKEKEGRFYCIYEVNDTNTYYAKGYVIISGTTIYSDLVSASGNDTKEYTI